MPLDYTDLVIAAIGSLTTLLTALIAAQKVKTYRNEKNQAVNEMRFQSAALDFAMFLDTWADIVEQVKILFEETELERFIVFRAFNGVTSPKWTTGVLQMRVDGMKPVSYVHYELDHDYITRLRFIETAGYDRLIFSELPQSGIKQIYQAEGVTDSLWALIDKRLSSDKKSAVITYCSFATTQDSGLSENTLTRCKVLTGRLKGAAQAFVN